MGGGKSSASWIFVWMSCCLLVAQTHAYSSWTLIPAGEPQHSTIKPWFQEIFCPKSTQVTCLSYKVESNHPLTTEVEHQLSKPRTYWNIFTIFNGTTVYGSNCTGTTCSKRVYVEGGLQFCVLVQNYGFRTAKATITVDDCSDDLSYIPGFSKLSIPSKSSDRSARKTIICIVVPIVAVTTVALVLWAHLRQRKDRQVKKRMQLICDQEGETGPLLAKNPLLAKQTALV